MTGTIRLEKESTNAIIGAFYEVYNTLGFGFLEHVYSLAMERELVARGRTVGREVGIKSSEMLPASMPRTLRNYLKAERIEVALILHFGPEARFYRFVRTNG